MLYRWMVPQPNRAGRRSAHTTVWDIDLTAITGFGCMGTLVSAGNSEEYKDKVGVQTRVQWPSEQWELVDELEEFVHEVRAKAGIGE